MPNLLAVIDWAALCMDAGNWLETIRRLGGIPFALFLAGLLAGFSHCTAMCGPFVLMQVMAGTSGGCAPPYALQRLSGAALLPYHFGRLTTYTGLGAVSGGLADVMTELFDLRWLAAMALMGAAVYSILLLSRALGWMQLRQPRRSAESGHLFRGAWAKLVSRAGRLGRFPLGLLLGLLPCGLVYAALAAAAGSGSASTAMLAMAAFGLGTVPGLIAVALAGRFVVRRFRKTPQVAAIPLLVLNVAILSGLAFRAFA